MDIITSHEWIYIYILKDKQSGDPWYLHLRCRKIKREEIVAITGKRHKQALVSLIKRKSKIKPTQ